MSRRAMNGDWVAIEGDRISLLATVEELREARKAVCDDSIIEEESEVETELYRHFDSAGKLLYVGISLNTVARLAQHRNESNWFKQIDTIKIQHFPTRGAALRAELAAIRTEKPKYNIAGMIADAEDDEPLAMAA